MAGLRPDARIRLKLAAALQFAYIWLMAGFFTGTLVLLGPVRWLTSVGRSTGWPQRMEDLAVSVLIILYVILSALLSWWLLGKVRRSEKSALRFGIPFAATVLALGALLP